MTFTLLGDRAVIAYAQSEAQAVRWAEAVRHAAPAWLEDVVPAYASVGVFYDNTQIRADAALAWLKTIKAKGQNDPSAHANHTIPICYELGPDLAKAAELTGLSPEYLIEQHLSVEYTVYAIGFVPGFPYLGYLPEALSGVPRLESPRLAVEPGSVGITGRQTGIYPLPRPGGWHLIGQTPLTIVHIEDQFFPMRVGDRVRFTRIDDQEFRRLQGERLCVNNNR